MKIFVFTSTFWGGGAERITYTLSCGLQDKGYDVTVVALNAVGSFAEQFKKKLKVVDLKVSLSPSWLMRPRAFFRIRRFLKEQSSGVVRCSHLPTLAIVVQSVLRTFFRKKFLSYHIEHGSFSNELFHGSRLRGKFIQFAARIFYPRFTRIIGVSDGVVQDILANGLTTKDKVLRIYNPVECPTQEATPRGERLHPFFELPDAKVVLGIGALVRGKGFHLLLRAFAALLEECSNLRLIILGKGDQRLELEALAVELGIADKVAFPGFQPDVFAWLSHADVFVLPSFSEGFSIVLVEAMACGVTPVSTDCEFGPSEILENGQWGYLVPVGDADALATGIRKALHSPFSPSGLRRRAADFSVDRAIKAYIDVLERDISASSIEHVV